MVQQDLYRKIAIVVSKELEPWQVLNTVAHVSANFGHFLEERFDTGDFFTTNDGIGIPRNTQYPIIIFQSDHATLQELARNARTTDDVQTMYFIREMIETSSDDEIQRIIEKKDFNEVDFLGVGLYGNSELLKFHTSKFKLWS